MTYSLPWWFGCKGRHNPLQQEMWALMHDSGLVWASKNLMKQLFGQLAIGCWRLPKPSKVTSKGLEVNKGEDHELIPKARVGDSLGLILGNSLGLTPELSPGPTLEANLGNVWELTVKATIMVTHGAYVPQSPDGPPPKSRVSFHNPDDIDPMKKEVSCLMETSVDDLETWLEFQAGQLGTPMWWEEQGAVPGIEDRCKFMQRIRVSFYVPEVQLGVSLEWGYTAPPAPHILDKGAFHLEKFAYQDVRQWPILLTIAYARCLQHWAEKHNLPRNPDFCPLAECVRELRQTVREFVNITYQDIMQGLEIEKPEASHLQLKVTIFSWVLSTPVDEPKVVEAPPHPVSPPSGDEAIWCTYPPPGLEQSDRYLLVVTMLVNWLDLGPGGSNVRESQSRRNIFQNPWMLAVFPPPWGVTHYKGATLTELDEWRTSPITSRWPTKNCHWTDKWSFPYRARKDIPNICHLADNQLLSTWTFCF